jgi:hypothetical protein
MITVNLTGGLGNQLFQYALGRYLATKLSAELVIEDSFYQDTKVGVTPRRYELDKFATQLRIVTDAERNYLRRYTNRWMRYIQKYISIPGKYRYVREPLDRLHLEVRGYSGNLFLDGYWQSDQYFTGIEDKLRQELQPMVALPSADQMIALSMKSANAVSLHVRRGDYITHAHTNAWHGVCGLDYYANAMRVIESHITNPHYFVFSDDMEWVKANLPINAACTYVSHNDGTTAVNDLKLMSSCQHHIIANSSFSWWGAWLNPHPCKLVIRPSTWLKQLPYMNESVCPQSWIKS